MLAKFQWNFTRPTPHAQFGSHGGVDGQISFETSPAGSLMAPERVSRRLTGQRAQFSGQIKIDR